MAAADPRRPQRCWKVAQCAERRRKFREIVSFSSRVPNPMTPAMPDEPADANQQSSYNQTIKSVHNRTKLRVSIPLLAQFQTRISKAETPKPGAGKCIDMEAQTRHSSD